MFETISIKGYKKLAGEDEEELIVYKRKKYNIHIDNLPSEFKGMYVYFCKNRYIILNNNLNENEKKLVIQEILNKVDMHVRILKKAYVVYKKIQVV